MVGDADAVYANSELILKVLRPDADRELPLIKPGAVLIGLLAPAGDPEFFQKAAAAGVTSLSMELVPRTTRAQMMDALSSQSTVAGYKAVLLAANALQKFFPMLMTAAGTVRPARVLVIGAGVAGLQAIATARRIGAVVEAFDPQSPALHAGARSQHRPPAALVGGHVHGRARPRPGTVFQDDEQPPGEQCPAHQLLVP